MVRYYTEMTINDSPRFDDLKHKLTCPIIFHHVVVFWSFPEIILELFLLIDLNDILDADHLIYALILFSVFHLIWYVWCMVDLWCPHLNRCKFSIWCFRNSPWRVKLNGNIILIALFSVMTIASSIIFLISFKGWKKWTENHADFICNLGHKLGK